ncbi:MAG: hypothetical protein MSIBF_05435 [Candidatus Altiarchaeales archaeon IMC4]|nr:MAG: hypothetical protein MSIBF_05435 [Candidatus Altiarchaeales archaeon IMC4]
MAHTKRITSGYGKAKKWVVTPNPGPHPKDNTIPILLLVRDLLGYADNTREAVHIISRGQIIVDGKPRKDPKYGVGLMDVIEIPKAKKCFRVMPSKAGLKLKDINKKEAGFKLCKILNKSVISGGMVQFNLHDGSNVLGENDYKTGETLILGVPGRKIAGSIKFDKGNIAIVVKGRHSGVTGQVTDIVDSTATRRSITSLGEIQTLTDYVFMIGEKKPEITV